ncbi:thermonuclease family protein [Halapricum sp. CBA1109]|uniref:thermonuclease family protein n=1 Tax=Halapricum sp. CBA1109 TaxID=2668068 RepID=UPI00351AE9B7
MGTKTLVFVALLTVLAGCSGAPEPGSAGPLPTGTANGSVPDGTTHEVTVVSVADGDTVDVRFANGTTDTVRLLGIDTPEVHVEVDPSQYEGFDDTEGVRSCLRAAGEDASGVVADRVDGETVTLAMDPESDGRGGYGRILGYLVHDGTNLNLALVEAGHARVYDSEFTLRSTFDSAEADARATDRGLWACG